MIALIALMLAVPTTIPSNVTYKATPTTPRSLASKLSDVVSVRDYGAVGDGVTDDTAAVQAALNAISSGGQLEFPCGTYKLTSAISVSSNQQLYGAGKVCASLAFSGATSGLTFAAGVQHFAVENLTISTSNAAALKAIDMSAGSTSGAGYAYFTIRNVQILATGPGRWAHGFYASFAESANVIGLRVYQSATIGVYLTDSVNQLKFYDLEITGGSASDLTYNRGIWADAPGTAAPEFFGATSQGCFSLGSAVYVSGHKPKFYGLHAEGTCVAADGGDVVVNGTSEVAFIGGHIVQQLVVTGTVRGFLADGLDQCGPITFATTVQGAFVMNSRFTSLTDSGTAGSGTNNGNGWLNVRLANGTLQRNKIPPGWDAAGPGATTNMTYPATANNLFPNGSIMYWLDSGGTALGSIQQSAADQLILTYTAAKQITFRNSTPTNKVILTDTSLALQAGVGLKITDTSAGTITLSAGTGTATVQSGTRCVCTDTTANASVKCAVATTTLTATGTGTDVIAYLCF